MLATVETGDTDEGLSAARKGLERLCLVTRTVKPVEQMIRFVTSPDGRVVPDIERKLPGRGAWLTASRAALETAVRSNAFSRAFRGEGSAGPELAELVERVLAKSALEALSLANKAGRVVTGFAKVEAVLGGQDIAVVINACDAAADGIRKLEAAARGAEASGRPRPMRVDAFRGEQLDLALGRPNVVHAALLAHPASAAFLARCLRLDHWRNGALAGETAVSGNGTN